MSTTLETPTQTTNRIDPKLIIPFVNSTLNVFTSMVKTKPEITRPRVKEDASASYDVSGIIGFSGEILGSVVLSLQANTALELVKSFTGMEMDLHGPDFADAIGELANMVAGGAKKDLGAIANITVPVVVIGKSHIIARLSDVPCITIPCRTTSGEFAIEVNIKDNKKS